MQKDMNIFYIDEGMNQREQKERDNLKTEKQNVKDNEEKISRVNNFLLDKKIILLQIINLIYHFLTNDRSFSTYFPFKLCLPLLTKR